MEKVSAIVPAYNESSRLARVLQVLTTYPNFSEVIVVNDGSTDDTKTQALKYRIRYLEHLRNKGKGLAMDTGVKHASGQIIFFSDADIKGLSHEIITDILSPVLKEQADMSIGIRPRKIYRLPLSRYYSLLIGGERAMRKEIWECIPSYYKQGFRIEVAMNYAARHCGRGLHRQIVPNLKQTIKEQKTGIIPGLFSRKKMVQDVATSLWHLYILRKPIPGLTQKNLSPSPSNPH